MNLKTTYSAIGVMAGSSMDGLDVIHIGFQENKGSWSFSIGNGETIQYDPEVYIKLKESSQQHIKKQRLLDVEFGNWIGTAVSKFIRQYNIKADLLAVHGHTVIHQPHNKISWQLGSGAEIAGKTEVTTITDFRNQDISLGGQGAPLVPMGDFHLFEEYDACLNLGGIANVSLRELQTAWDITPCNQILNFYAKQLGKEFDENGQLAREGDLYSDFIQQMEKISFFQTPAPKSLPNNFISVEVLKQLNPKDGLRTISEFIAKQTAEDLRNTYSKEQKILVTGGGAHNDFLIERLKHHLSNWEVIVPSKLLIDFKEAIVFAFLGVLRMRNERNVLASVTGASKDTSSGVIHFTK